MSTRGPDGPAPGPGRSDVGPGAAGRRRCPEEPRGGARIHDAGSGRVVLSWGWTGPRGDDDGDRALRRNDRPPRACDPGCDPNRVLRLFRVVPPGTGSAADRQRRRTHRPHGGGQLILRGMVSAQQAEDASLVPDTTRTRSLSTVWPRRVNSPYRARRSTVAVPV